jgi:predicted PurR-regulated permease PerM
MILPATNFRVRRSLAPAVDRDMQAHPASPVPKLMVGEEMERTNRPLAPAAVARAVLITLGLIALALLLWAGRNVLFVLFFGLLVGVFLTVFTDRLVQWGVPRVLSVVVVLAVVAGSVGAFSVLLWPTVREQLSMLGRELPEVVEEIAQWTQTQYREATGRMGEPPVDLEEQVRGTLTAQAGAVIGGAVPIINTALGAITGILVVLVIGIYTAVDPDMYRRGVERLIPPRHRPRVVEAMDRTGHSLRRWMIGTLINMVIVGTGTAVGLWLLGIPAAIALGVIAGILEFIPIVGPILAAFPAIFVALTVSPMTAVWVTVFYLVIQQVESNVLTPVVMRGAVRLPPALTVFFQTLMAVIFGFLGLLLAVPILAVVMVMVKTLYVEPMEGKPVG